VTESTHRKVKTAMDETRLLILGAQILLGFHLNGAFQSGFGKRVHGEPLSPQRVLIQLTMSSGLYGLMKNASNARSSMIGGACAEAPTNDTPRSARERMPQPQVHPRWRSYVDQ
jgi:hypothetical protein